MITHSNLSHTAYPSFNAIPSSQAPTAHCVLAPLSYLLDMQASYQLNNFDFFGSMIDSYLSFEHDFPGRVHPTVSASATCLPPLYSDR